MPLDPVTMSALIAAGSAAVQGGLGALGARSEKKERERLAKPYMQAQERRENLIQELLRSLEGEGKYSEFFRADPESFKKSVVDPAKGMFEREIAPSIQQAAIAGGTQRGSTTEDQLLRAGVNLDEMINRAYMDYQRAGQERATSAIGSILGASPPQPLSYSPTPTSSFAGAAAGFMESDAFSDFLASFTRRPEEQKPGVQQPSPARPGYTS